MSLEFTLWIIGWVLLSEAIFIIQYMGDKTNWIEKKMGSFFFGALIIIIHGMIGFMGNDCQFLAEDCSNINYWSYVYELFIIAGIAILFGMNKLITVVIDRW